jgi:predicted  nucleic acid-binding Zn-ribbon protein
VKPHLQALLTLQDRDDELTQLENKLEALRPRLAALDAERASAERQRATTRGAIEREEQRQRELSSRADDFRKLNARAVAHMDQVRKVHEANAAAAQVDISRRALADVENELGTVTQRLTKLRDSDVAAELGLAELDERQSAVRAELEAKRGEVERELSEARARRQQAAAHVDPRTLQRYDRVRSRRRARSVFPLRGTSCSNCDTAVPTQRRAALASGDIVDVCESCGVLLYAEPGGA